MYFNNTISYKYTYVEEDAKTAAAAGIIGIIAAMFTAHHIKTKRQRKKFYEKTSRELYNNMDVIKRSIRDYLDLHPEVKEYEDVKISSLSNDEINKYAMGKKVSNDKDYKFMVAHRGAKSPENSLLVAIYDFNKRETSVVIVANEETEIPKEAIVYLVALCSMKVGIYDGYIDLIVQETKTDDINQNAITYRNSNKAINKH